MSSTEKSFVGWMMGVYRISPFHNAFVGAILAKVLAFFTVFKIKQVVYKRCDRDAQKVYAYHHFGDYSF